MQSVQERKNIIVEAANALMLDVNCSSYPLITSSNTTLVSIISGLTLNPKNIIETIGIVKACTARVGDWPGRGIPTGRRRRCGWFGLVVVKYSTSINYCNFLNLTKLDALDTFDTIKVAIAYKFDGVELEHYPADLDMLAQAEVVYHELPGWQKPTTGANTFYGLPKQAR
ncbi:P-loop containing nucleoside triphosphate hydrolase protein [Fusarium oxysporum II5]|uniref:Adenylosuccinate synthetase n=1 Tax=Fusarium odoratissimum (strain NRRL 54006) TaxID=1089451 RepID=X0LCV8_FUSO5|nr:adenylosuccinate synthetase [Fusarium odoratissimum NRRL 54006]EXM06670.1 adenylosuccinate synthetase [Fusarium odoratissimum NRRL 54006]KAK2132817.1 P-loop containing nucleoside triphosphate hydrolase protein [Fusarium oxysporum II5]